MVRADGVMGVLERLGDGLVDVDQDVGLDGSD